MQVSVGSNKEAISELHQRCDEENNDGHQINWTLG